MQSKRANDAEDLFSCTMLFAAHFCAKRRKRITLGTSARELFLSIACQRSLGIANSCLGREL